MLHTLPTNNIPITPGHHLESSDGVAVDLLPLLDWRPLLAALAPLQETSARNARGVAQEWATHFVLFAMRACVVLQQEVCVGCL